MIDKKPSHKGKKVRVTFEVPESVAEQSVAVVGEFNEWSLEKDKMKLDSKKGVWTKSKLLDPGASYQFRYFVDGIRWHNDETADGYVSNEYFSENCLLNV